MTPRPDPWFQERVVGEGFNRSSHTDRNNCALGL